MALTTIFSKDLLDRYTAGERTFSSINLQYADISGALLKDIIIKDSRLYFVTFRDCNFSNAKFINCEIIYGSFYGGNMGHAVFEECNRELTLFENIIFKNTNISKSRLTWCAIFNTALGELNLSSSTLFRTFTDPSKITQRDIEEAMNHMGPMMDKLDISIRARIKEEMLRDAARYEIDIKSAPSPDKAGYGSRHSSGNYGTASASYGTSMQHFIDNVISAYNAANPYHTKKKGYDTDKQYG